MSAETQFLQTLQKTKQQVVEVNETKNVVSICFSVQYLIEIKYLKDIVNLIIALIEKFGFSFTINKKKW